MDGVPIYFQFGSTKIWHFSNGPASQYSMKNDQYIKDLISAADIMKSHWHDDYGTRNTEKKTSKHEDFKKGNK